MADLVPAHRVKDLPGYLTYRAFSAIFGVLPEPVMRRLGTGAGRLLGRVAKGRRLLATKHMTRVLGEAATRAEIEEAVDEMFASYGRYWAEVFWTRPRRVEQIFDATEVINAEPIVRARDAGKGIILALPHLGNWEAAGPQAHHLGIPVLAVAEALPNQKIVDWFLKARGFLGIEVIIPGMHDNISGRLKKRLEEGGTIALVTDRDIDGKGVEVEFFGEVTTMPAGPVSLSIRTGAPVIPVGAFFNPGKGHRFVVHDPVDIPTEGRLRERVALGTQNMANVFESFIRQDPSQWHLFQPNWPSDRDLR